MGFRRFRRFRGIPQTFPLAILGAPALSLLVNRLMEALNAL